MNDTNKSHTTRFWINGSIVEPENATISVLDHGLLYGDGVFEGIRYYNGNIFRLQAHLNRLRNSLKGLAIEIDYTDIELEEALSELIDSTNKQAEFSSAYIRLIVTRGAGTLGIDPRSCGKPSVIMILAPLSLASAEANQSGLKVIVSSVRRVSADMLNPQIKSLNYLNNILARMQATAAQADEAIMLNAKGYVAEASTENIFLVKNDIIVTPSLDQGLLEGITRAEIIKIATTQGFTVEQTQVSVSDLYEADEVFLTGTGAELLAIREIDGYEIKCPGEIFKSLRADYMALVS